MVPAVPCCACFLLPLITSCASLFMRLLRSPLSSCARAVFELFRSLRRTNYLREYKFSCVQGYQCAVSCCFFFFFFTITFLLGILVERFISPRRSSDRSLSRTNGVGGPNHSA
uniref:Secreted protein n=1 Tax=Ixodes ricinus TaxID=34613 RepID=A0A6B0UKN9_IXORI